MNGVRQLEDLAMSKSPSAGPTQGATAKGRLLLASGAVGALATLNARRPLSRSGVGSIASFVAGVGVADLPLQALATQAATAGHLVARGALRSRAGQLGLALNLASWAGLADLHRSAQGDRERLEDALLAGLGADYRERLGKIGPAADLPLTRRQIAIPNRRHGRFRAQRDLAYGDAGVRNQLDVWHRADLDLSGGAPVLLQIHGGAWVFGNKNSQALPLMAHLAERGWVCVSMNYRLGPTHPWPAQIVDVKRALAWIRATIAEHGGNQEFVAVTGGSAGGHLAALAALTANDPAFQPGFEEADTSVQAAAPLYGQYDLVNDNGLSQPATISHLERFVFKQTMATARSSFEAASPLHRITEDAPPFFVVHGTNDTLLPVAQARHFAAELRRRSRNPVVFAELPKAQHSFDIVGAVRNQHVVRAAERFLLWAQQAYEDGAVVA
jgi:acetyl esterase/lipase